MRHDATAHVIPAVAEIQGLYGAFSFPEKLLQKIWLRGDFDRSRTIALDGRRIRIVHPGKWNLLGGPDFHGARLRFDDGPEITGDIEVHLHASDWDAHAHARDPAYDRVILHVVLFPPDSNRATIGGGGREIPVVVLLPLLHHDLEEFAAEDAVEVLANRAMSRLPDELGMMPAADLHALLQRHALARWQQKVRFAGLRIQRLGWDAACHHAALEILGYRFNRAPMLRIAGASPLARWSAGLIDSDEMFASESGGWSLQGVRPANHPRARLRQYAGWVRARPDWPEQLSRLGASWPKDEAPAGAGTRQIRRDAGIPGLRTQVATEMCGDAISGTRLDNMICDGFLPLLAAHHGRDVHGLWFHWFAGDLPPVLTSGLRQLGIFDGRIQPSCHGLAQGLLGWLLEREASR